MSLRGREYISELRGNFTALPDSIIMKPDMLREGVRYTPGLEEAGHSCNHCV